MKQMGFHAAQCVFVLSNSSEILFIGVLAITLLWLSVSWSHYIVILTL